MARHAQAVPFQLPIGSQPFLLDSVPWFVLAYRSAVLRRLAIAFDSNRRDRMIRGLLGQVVDLELKCILLEFQFLTGRVHARRSGFDIEAANLDVPTGPVVYVHK